MTVYELIRKMTEFDPNLEVVFDAKFEINQEVKADIERNGEIETEKIWAEVEIDNELEVDEIELRQEAWALEKVVVVKLEY